MPYQDDPDQLPELPDPGPRDGRHGVDRDAEFDPYPSRHMGEDTAGGVLHVSLEDAKWHLARILDRVETGEEIIITRHGHPVARLVPALVPAHVPADTVVAELEVDTVTVTDTTVFDGRTDAAVTVERTLVSSTVTTYNEDDQLPELPDPGPRDGRHGVDRDAGFADR